MCTCRSPQVHLLGGQPASGEVLSSCGYPTPLVQLRILDEEELEVADGKHDEICVPDEDWGETVQAVVRFKPNAQVEAAELIALCKDTFGSFKSPKSVDIVASLPRSPNGKVMKRELRDRYWTGRERRV